MIDYSEGRLFLKDKEWVLDAEPHVTTLFERLFPSSRYEYDNDGECQYTHRPRMIQDILSVRKDVAWFMQRYLLKISDEDRLALLNGAKKYDAEQEAAKKAYFENEQVNLPFAFPLRDYQNQAVALTLHRKSLLIADQIGLGKTPCGIAIGSKSLPCLCVVPPHLTTQWEEEIHKFLPNVRVHRIVTGKHYVMPHADFYVISYTLVGKWVEQFTKTTPVNSIVFDEIHSLRRVSTVKYSASASIAEKCKYRVGLSATPIMNYGEELFNIFQILEPGKLGDAASFHREWCGWGGKLKDPLMLGDYLRKNMMMIRRTRQEVHRDMEAVNRIVYDVDADMETLKALEEETKVLAYKVISGTFKESGEAARELDWKLRHDTGVAKAKSVAETVKIILESGEKVVLFAWHRDCYDIYLKSLAEYQPVLYTGSESPIQKQENIKRFIESDCKVFIMSLRSGAGVNGLQSVASYCVFGELDWSPGVIDQCIGRLWRDGQKEQVTAIFVTIEDGADPFMKKVIGLKSTEAKQIINPDSQVLATSDNERILSLAKDYLRRRGEDVDGLLKARETERSGELYIDPPKPDDNAYLVFELLNKSVFDISVEGLLQKQIEELFKKNNIVFEREFKLSDRSRVDFKVGETLVECKARGFSKVNLLKQIKRYQIDYPLVKAIIVITPEKLRNFSMNKVPVYCINVSNQSLLMGGLS